MRIRIHSEIVPLGTHADLTHNVFIYRLALADRADFPYLRKIPRNKLVLLRVKGSF
jgi:hypothetical protein